jgi:hypothetical protein
MLKHSTLDQRDQLDLKVKNYSELLALTEESTGYIRQAELANKAKKLAWSKFFACRKRIKSLKMNMGIQIEEEISPRSLDFTNE